MAQRQRLLLVGGQGDDAPGVVRALDAAGCAATVLAAPDAAAARALLASDEAVTCVLVAAAGDALKAAGWRRLLDDVGARAPVVVVVGAGEDAAALEWLRGGAAGWTVRPGFDGLAAALGRLEFDAQQQASREASERRLAEATAALLALARSPAFRGDSPGEALRETTAAGARGLPATVCAVWLLDEAGTKLKLADLFDARTGQHQRGALLPFAADGAYFRALSTEGLLAVEDAVRDARTAEFADSYFVPAGIGSTLDVAVRLRGETVGAICLEQAGATRRWTAGEQVFAGALAEVASLALESAERHRAEAALLRAERRFRDIFEYTTDAVLLCRVALDGSVFGEDMNAAAEAVSGLKRADVVGRTAHELLGGPSADTLVAYYRQCVEARAPVTVEYDVELPVGPRRVSSHFLPLFDEQGRVHRLAVVSRDVTAARAAEEEQRRLATEAAEAAKNEALARLAEHVAHDVNNLLTVMGAHAARLAGLTGTAAEAAAAIAQATARGRELTRQVLSFGRQQPLERVPLEFAPLVREALSLLGPTAPGVAVREVLAAGATPVHGDASQLHRVLTNLCANALQAMPDGGTLTVQLEAVEVTPTFAARNAPLTPGPWVRLDVIDTGVGMDEETRRRAFEPFFSTRGDGTGLGLAVVQRVVAAHGGAVFVESAPGQGTTFRVFLPAQRGPGEAAGAGQHLMLVDDHPGMARVSAKLLETLGYRTSVFDDPRAALAAFQAAPQGYDAVLTDLSMPQMSGADFALALKALRPNLPVILSSGVATQLDPAELSRLGIAAVLAKPWRLEEAIATLQRVLAR